MEIEDVRKAQRIADNLEKIRKQLKDLDRTKNIDSVSVQRYQSGAPEYSYDVSITNNSEFMSTVKSLIKDYLKREEAKLSAELNAL